MMNFPGWEDGNTVLLTRSLTYSKEGRDALGHKDCLGALSSPCCSGVLCRPMKTMPLRHRSVLVDAVRREHPILTQLNYDMTNVDAAPMFHFRPRLPGRRIMTILILINYARQ